MLPIKAAGKKIKNKDKECFNMKIHFTKEISKIMKFLDMVFISRTMELNMKEIGKMGNFRDKEK